MENRTILGLRVLGTVIALAVASAAALFWWAPWGVGGPFGPAPVPLRLAVPQQAGAGAYFIAEQAGLFRRNGLDVSLQRFAIGREALAQVIAGQADVAIVADTPIVFASLKGEQLSVLASIYQNNDYHQIVARKDRGIEKPADLKDKTLGYLPGTSMAYFAHAYALLHGLGHNPKKVVNVPPPETTRALLEGKVDAVVVFPPHGDLTAQALGGSATVLRDPTIYQFNFCLVSQRAWAEANPQAVQRLLRAFSAATQKIRQEPTPSFAAIAAETRVSAAAVERDWKNAASIDLRLHPELLAMLEVQQDWALSQGLVPVARQTSMRALILTEGLQAVDPAAVTLRR